MVSRKSPYDYNIAVNWISIRTALNGVSDLPRKGLRVLVGNSICSFPAKPLSFLHSLDAENHCFPAVYKIISGERMAMTTHLHFSTEPTIIIFPSRSHVHVDGGKNAQ